MVSSTYSPVDNPNYEMKRDLPKGFNLVCGRTDKYKPNGYSSILLHIEDGTLITYIDENVRYIKGGATVGLNSDGRVVGMAGRTSFLLEVNTISNLGPQPILMSKVGSHDRGFGGHHSFHCADSIENLLKTSPENDPYLKHDYIFND